jgi:hypothetical protein
MVCRESQAGTSRPSCSGKSVDELPVEVLSLENMQDVDEADQVGEAILEGVKQEQDECGLGIEYP